MKHKLWLEIQIWKSERWRKSPKKKYRKCWKKGKIVGKFYLFMFVILSLLYSHYSSHLALTFSLLNVRIILGQIVWHWNSSVRNSLSLFVVSRQLFFSWLLSFFLFYVFVAFEIHKVNLTKLWNLFFWCFLVLKWRIEQEVKYKTQRERMKEAKRGREGRKEQYPQLS